MPPHRGLLPSLLLVVSLSLGTQAFLQALPARGLPLLNRKPDGRGECTGVAGLGELAGGLMSKRGLAWAAAGAARRGLMGAALDAVGGEGGEAEVEAEGEGEEEEEEGPPPHIEVVYEDESLIVVSKPPNMLVHRTKESRDKIFLLQTLRNQLGGRQIFFVNRLDRAVSGLMLCTFDGETAALAQAAMQDEGTVKEYVAVVRGPTPAGVFISDRPLTDKGSKNRVKREALSTFETLCTFPVELEEEYDPSLAGPMPDDDDEPGGAPTLHVRNITASVVSVRISTGRRHQIRRHLQHMSNHIFGDTTYGKGRMNTALRDQYGLPRLCLHSRYLEFTHPVTGARVRVTAPMADDMRAFLHKIPAAPKDLIDTL